MSNNKSYRINTNINSDAVLNVQINQDIDFLELLSLKLYQKDFYQLKASNYGLIVGRIQANDGFGVPNVKVSVFIKLSDEDRTNTEITNIYPYIDIQTRDKDKRRYNLLPDTSNNDCYQIVGTFPNKRLVLDNDTYIDVYDKYWKYTTITNHAGDYMIFGVPVGMQTVHIDLDLSDIGILSQKPRDMYYKGYNPTQFESANQFKNSTSLGGLTQIISQDRSVRVYPFWGDKDTSDTIAITRCDLDVEYKFEPTCVFMGSIITDDYSNNISHSCTPTKGSGSNATLTTQSGTIEMIRKTVDGLVEEFPIQGTELIDGDGVWCYQIPMNLDYVKTDEYGNLVPTDNPNQGIATRTSVRFRVSLNETGNEGIGRHRAKYLIPNNLELEAPNDRGVNLADKDDFQQCFEFGSNTPDSQFRDLYWNKIYSVKNYIPRIQTNNNSKTENYSGIRGVNLESTNNPHPFNKIRLNTPFVYSILCVLMQVVFLIASYLNNIASIFNKIASIKIFGFRPFKWLYVGCIKFTFYGVGMNGEDECYAPGCWSGAKGCRQSYKSLVDRMQQALARHYNLIYLDFFNDWVNGTLYMPLWLWKKTKKKKYLFGLFSKRAQNSYCGCNQRHKNVRLFETCAMDRATNLAPINADAKNPHQSKASEHFSHGIVYEKTLKNEAKVYYYTPGYNSGASNAYSLLYSTDIILLGSFNSCDFDALPNIATLLPSTTANIPFLTTVREQLDEDGDSDYENIVPGGVDDNSDDKNSNDDDTTNRNKTVEVSGMDWTYQGKNETPKYKSGLFLDISCGGSESRTKSCINANRLCELGVSLDSGFYTKVPNENDGFDDVYVAADGMILRHEIDDNETRAMFATMNHNGFSSKYRIRNEQTSYDTYLFHYLYPINFDGTLKNTANRYGITSGDYQDKSYVNFRYGTSKDKPTLKDIQKYNNSFLLTNNSFYFYFGLHVGKTAIDKYRELYDASCVKNEKQAFTFNITTINSQITQNNGEINFQSSTIRSPYAIDIYNEKNEKLQWEKDSDKSNSGDVFTLIGYVSGGTDETQALLSNNVNFSGLPNDTYKVVVIDSRGNELYQIVTLNEINIQSKISTEGLGLKYVSGVTTIEDYKSKKGNCGEIRLFEFKIGETVLNLGNIEKYVSSGDSGYYVTFYDEEKQKVTYRMKVLFGDTVAELPVDPDYETESNKLVIYVAQPGYYTITWQRFLSNNELKGGVVKQRVNITNNERFHLYVNDTPIDFVDKEDYVLKPLNLSSYKLPNGDIVDTRYRNSSSTTDADVVSVVGDYFICKDNNIEQWGSYVKGLSRIYDVEVPQLISFTDAQYVENIDDNGNVTFKEEYKSDAAILENKKNQTKLSQLISGTTNVDDDILLDALSDFEEEFKGIINVRKKIDYTADTPYDPETIKIENIPTGLYSLIIEKEMYRSDLSHMDEELVPLDSEQNNGNTNNNSTFNQIKLQSMGVKEIDITQKPLRKVMQMCISMQVGENGMIFSPGFVGANNIQIGVDNTLILKSPNLRDNDYFLYVDENHNEVKLTIGNDIDGLISGDDRDYTITWGRPYKVWLKNENDNLLWTLEESNNEESENEEKQNDEEKLKLYSILSISSTTDFYKTYINEYIPTLIETYKEDLESYSDELEVIKDTLNENGCILIEYILNNMINIARGSIVSDGNSGFNLKVKGGKTPSLLCSEYVNYNSIEEPFDGCQRVTHSASTTRINCDEVLPTIVKNENYGYFDNQQQWIPLLGVSRGGGYSYNSLLLKGRQNLGNYVAAFDNGGDTEDKTYDMKSQPNGAQPFEILMDTTHNWINSTEVENYFPLQFVDRHIGYNIRCVMPYSMDVSGRTTEHKGALTYDLLGGLRLPFYIEKNINNSGSSSYQYTYELIHKMPMHVGKIDKNYKYVYNLLQEEKSCTVHVYDNNYDNNYDNDYDKLTDYWYKFSITQLNGDGAIVRYTDGNLQAHTTFDNKNKQNQSRLTKALNVGNGNQQTQGGINTDIVDDWSKLPNGTVTFDDTINGGSSGNGQSTSSSNTVTNGGLLIEKGVTSIDIDLSSCSANMEPTYYKDNYSGEYIMSLKAVEGENVKAQFDSNVNGLITFIKETPSSDENINQFIENLEPNIVISGDSGTIYSTNIRFKIKSNFKTYTTWPISVTTETLQRMTVENAFLQVDRWDKLTHKRQFDKGDLHLVSEPLEIVEQIGDIEYRYNENNNLLMVDGKIVDDASYDDIIFSYQYDSKKPTYVLIAQHRYNSDVYGDFTRKELVQYHAILGPSSELLNPYGYSASGNVNTTIHQQSILDPNGQSGNMKTTIKMNVDILFKNASMNADWIRICVKTTMTDDVYYLEWDSVSSMYYWQYYRFPYVDTKYYKVQDLVQQEKIIETMDGLHWKDEDCTLFFKSGFKIGKKCKITHDISLEIYDGYKWSIYAQINGTVNFGNGY